MRRIALVIHAISAGGAERVMVTMANHWAREGREVILLTLDDGSELPFYELDARISHRSLGVAGVSATLWRSIINNIQRIRILRSAFKAAAPEAVITFMSSVNVIALLAATGLGIPVIVSERVDPRYHPVGHLWEGLRRVLYRRASRVVFQSAVAMEDFSGAVRRRSVVIPNPVPATGERHERYDALVAPRQRHRRTILAVGRLEDQKGFDLLFVAFSRLASRHVDWGLEIFGDGSCRSFLEEEICKAGLEDRVFLRGITHDTTAEFQRADLFVLSSRYEGFPNALCEAMASGLPVIAFDCPSGPGEIIRDGVDGILVPAGDVDALSRAMDRLMASEDERRRLAGRAPEVTARFGVDLVMARWLAVVDEVILNARERQGDLPIACRDSIEIASGGGRPDAASATIFPTIMQKQNLTAVDDRDGETPASRCRVLFIIRALAFGGAERQLIELVKAMNKERFLVTVATFYDTGKLGDEVRAIPGINVVSLQKKGRWDMARFLTRFVSLVRKFRPDIVHGYMGTSNELALLARWVCGCRAVWGIRGSGCDYTLYHDWGRNFGHWTEKKLSRFADCIIANSEAGRRDCIRDGYEGSRMKVICNGIDTARFEPNREAGLQVRREWGVPVGVPLIGIVARLDPMKDHAAFLSAAALLASRRPDVRFVCVGDGPHAYRARLFSLAEELQLQSRLEWHGARSDVAAVYNALTILTSSSAFGEGFSNVIGEAMACGTPVVATDVGDAAAIINDPAMIVPPGCPEKLVAAWESVLERPAALVASRAQDARDRIIREYGMARLASRTEETLLETLHCRK